MINLSREEITASTKLSSPNRVQNGQEESPTIEQQILEQVTLVKQWQENLDISISKSQQSTERMAAVIDATTKISMPDWSQSDFAKSILDRMVESLGFPEIRAREERIACAHAKTFEWIFCQSDTPPKHWSSFLDWLQYSSDVYWITGKAGSGKSTLVKYIMQNPRTEELLKVWAGEEHLIVSSFYFWHAGTEIQKSKEGLVRTILYQALTQVRKVISKNTLLRWTSFALSRDPHNPWSWRDLEQAFKLLLADYESPLKYCFFIDGLDELRGDLSDLIILVHRISSYANVKVCVSSRPWMILEDEYGTKPHLMLQHLTYPDIKHYIDSTLTSYMAFKECRALDEEYAATLIENVAGKSSGVFLWVVLVVRSLVEGLRDGDRLSDPQARVDCLPPELEDLFKRMLHDFDPRYFSHASALFQIFKASMSLPSLICLSFADEEDVDLAIRADMKPMQARQRYYRAVTMRRRLDSRSKGLLEVATSSNTRLNLKDQFALGHRPYALKETLIHANLPTETPSSSHQFFGDERSLFDLDSFLESDKTASKEVDLFVNEKVDYLHRTVKDFLDRPEIWDQFRSATTHDFDPYASLARAHMLQLKWLQSDAVVNVSAPEWDSVFWMMRYAAKAESKGALQAHLIEEFERITPKLFPGEYQQFLGNTGGQSSLLQTDLQVGSAVSKDLLHLVVQCGLSKYLEVRLIKDPQDRQTIISLLSTAVFKYAIDYTFQDGSLFHCSEPNVKVVKVLLDRSDIDDVQKARWLQHSQCAVPPARYTGKDLEVRH
jgi:hypothetical protein